MHSDHRRATHLEPEVVRSPMQTVRDGSRWMIRLDDGQDLFDALSEFAVREQVRAGTVVFGIGMFRLATFGYWDGKQYQPQELTVPHEVVVTKVFGSERFHGSERAKGIALKKRAERCLFRPTRY